MSTPEPNNAAPNLSPVLDPLTFEPRLAAEVARLRRSGGFLSLVLVGRRPGPEGPVQAQERVIRIADRVRRSVRAQDVLAWRSTTVAILMPDTDSTQAQRAADRLLHSAQEEVGGLLDRRPTESAGVATVFGEAEGGADALLAAAEEAYQEAGPGDIVVSRSLCGRPRILVVDDDGPFAQALAGTVSERGWEGHPCTEAADALARVKGSSYAALFVDLVLPGSSGVAILREALASHPRRPVVLMSGYDATREAVIDALSLGPVVFVSKPISPADLDAALEMFRALLPGSGPR